MQPTQPGQTHLPGVIVIIIYLPLSLIHQGPGGCSVDWSKHTGLYGGSEGVGCGKHSRVALLVASFPPCPIPQSGSLFQSHLRGKDSRCPPFPHIYQGRFPGSFKDHMPVGGGRV